ncbi:MAG TPA: YidC/Oxa1 family insertase periplasmic-domain containing protein, partial [Pirellulaceae bacterium]|nr:YidC/Oxa1 family insertase periplasmic-domain containing protein [Pirellulaceae bacterium]
EFEVLPPGEPAEQHPLSCLLTVVNGRPVAATKKDQAEAIFDPLREANWKVNTITSGKQPVIECSYTLTAAEAKSLGLNAPVEVIKRYSVAEITNPEDQDNAYAMAYHVDCELELRNLGTEAQEVSWQLDGPNGLPFEGWWYSNKISPGWGAAGARDLVWRRHENTRSFRSCPSIYTYAAKNPTKPAESMLGTDDATQLDYVGVDGQYFSAVLIPDVNSDVERSSFRKAVTKPVYGIENIKKVDYKRTNVSFQVTSVPHALAVDGSFKQTMRLFAGPKVPALMAKYDLDDVIEYGWFKMVSIPLSSLLHFLRHYVVFNYALAIIALTVIVRGCMYPFSRQAAKNAQIMQEISPEIKKIAEKYKNDLQKRSDAQSELFKKYNYHPLSGCLPMFLQLPIFLGLYRSLAVDIELRQAALIPGIEWCSNLAGPDMLFFWKPYLPEFLGGEAAGWLGPYFNLLPLISVALLQVHQRLFTPPATDEQTKMTQDMMKYTTLFMGVLFFKVPAGLCIYFITSSLWSVCERVFLPKVKAPVPGAPVPEKTSFFAKKPSTNGEEKAKPTKKQRKR